MKITRDLAEAAFRRALFSINANYRYMNKKMKLAMENYDNAIEEGYTPQKAVEEIVFNMFDRDLEEIIFKDLGI